MPSVTPAAAQQDDPEPAGGELRLLSQSPYVAPDGEFTATLHWSGPTDGVFVSALVRGRIDHESQLGTNTGVLNRVEPVPIEEIHTGDGHLLVEIPIRSFTPAPDDQASRVWVPEPGVYPIDIEIRDTVGSVASIQLYLIRLSTETDETDLLPVSLLIPAGTAEGLSLDDIMGLLERHPTTRISLYLDAGTVTALLEDHDQVERLATVLGDRNLIVGPAVDLDPSALARISHGGLYADAITRHFESLTEVGLTADRSVLALRSTLTAEGAELLVEMGTRVVLDLGGRGDGAILTPNGPLRVQIPDNELTDMLVGGERSVQQAHRLLARLALRNEADPTPVLLGGPTLRQSSLTAVGVVLEALDTVGLLEAVDLTDLAALSPSLTIRPAENPSQDLAPVRHLIDEAIELLTIYEGFHQSGPIEPDEYQAALASALSPARNPNDRLRAFDQLTTLLVGSLDVIELRDGQSVTMTARRLSIPISLENHASGARRIRLEFTGDRVEVAEHGEVVVIPPGVTTIDVNVEARALGVSPLDVRVLTPDGSLLLSQTRLQIRSTAIPGLGLLLSGTALVFLVSWWIVSIGRSRAQKPPSTPSSTPFGGLREVEPPPRPVNVGATDPDEPSH